METNKEQMTPEQQNREWAEEAFWTGHCHYLMQALALAMQRCQVWRLAGTDSVFTLIEIFNFAKAYDEEHELPEGQFYRTTVEGAIGLCLGAEYITQWLFTPMEPGAERDALLEELKQKLDAMEAEEKKIEAAAAAQPAAPVRKTPPPMRKAAPSPAAPQPAAPAQPAATSQAAAPKKMPPPLRKN